jgi:hypothetical protein
MREDMTENHGELQLLRDSVDGLNTSRKVMPVEET